MEQESVEITPRSHERRAKAIGWPTALMSSVPDSVRASPLTSLRRPPDVLGKHER
jgi:hypothetical protein